MLFKILRILPFILAIGMTSPAFAEGKHLFILSGQSNMAMQQPEAAFTPRVEEVFPAESFIVVHDAKGGEPIRRWVIDWEPGENEPKGRHGDLYMRLIDKVKSATEGQDIETITFIWMQGEANANKKNNGWETYSDNFMKLIAQLEADLGHDDINVVMCRISDYGITDEGSRMMQYPGWESIRTTQAELCADKPNWVLLSTDEFNGRNNDLHYTKKGRKAFGIAMADSAVELLQAKKQ